MAFKELIADAESVRANGISPDWVVLKAIGLGVDTRQQLKDILGFGYDVIEKALERSSADLRSETRGGIERFSLASSGATAKVEYVCVDCGGPRSYGSGQRCKACYDAKSPTKAARRAEGVEAEGAPNLCFCGRVNPPGGRHRGTHRGKAKSAPYLAVPVVAAEVVSAPVTPADAGVPAVKESSIEVYGGVRHQEGSQVSAQEMASWSTERVVSFLDELFGCADMDVTLAMVDAIENRKPAREITLAWSKEFESPDPEGISGMTMLYLVSLLHDGMEQNEKDAVWTLIQYLKRVDATVARLKSTASAREKK